VETPDDDGGRRRVRPVRPGDFRQSVPWSFPCLSEVIRCGSPVW
jgi:hypothetical protein